MGRLLDEDVILKTLEHLGWLDDTDLDDVIKEVPTAYDVDKVVEEFETEIDSLEYGEDDYFCQLNCGVDGGCIHPKGYRCSKCMMEKAIDIVKKGGV